METNHRTMIRRYDCSLMWRIDDLDLIRECSSSIFSGKFPSDSTTFQCQVELYHIHESKEFGLILELRPIQADAGLYENEDQFFKTLCVFEFYDHYQNVVRLVNGQLCRNMFSFRVEDLSSGISASDMRLRVSVSVWKWHTTNISSEAEDGNSERVASFVQRLQSMFEFEKFTDVTIESPGRKFKAHKCILAAHSPVFEAMFANAFSESSESVVKVTDVDVETISLLLQYMYKPENPALKSIEQAVELYAVADKYQMAGLVKICRTFLLMNSVENDIPALLSIAEMHSDRKFKISLEELFRNRDS